MGVRHRELPIEGVQFHPEIVLTPLGPAMARNFLRMIVGPAIQLLLDGHDLSRDGRARADGLDHGRRGDAGADRRLPRRAAHEGRDGRRDRRLRRGDARARPPGRRRSASTSSTSSAPAATARTRSTSRPRRRSWPRRPARRVAKHGNRAASSAAGSADVLEALGFDLEQPPERIARSIDELGFGFMFARAHHPAMRHAAPVRQELGMRTVFNVLGPLDEPGGRRDEVFGVYSAGARADARRGARRARRPARVRRARRRRDRRALAARPEPRLRGRRRRRPRAGARPADLGLEPADPDALARRLGRRERRRRSARSSPASRAARRDAVLLNAAGAIAAAGLADDLVEGLALGAETIDSGAAHEPPRRARRLLGRGARPDGTLRRTRSHGPGLGAIAEIKRRSPSAGDLRPDADPAADRRRLRRRGRGGDLGARRRALRRHLGRPARRPGRDRRRRCSPRASSRPTSTCGPRRRRARTRCCCSCATSTTPRRARLMQVAAEPRARHARRGARRRGARPRHRSRRRCSGSTRAISRRSRSTGGAQLELVARIPRRPRS